MWCKNQGSDHWLPSSQAEMLRRLEHKAKAKTENIFSALTFLYTCAYSVHEYFITNKLS